ncbi:MerR family transcriptional regulator [Loigolactobacillus zhaoyuanensis]|uniref:MerR family transcriptional regulator n=1 Tax=Loigolactobacillus zhaoyuanensis TaxID=2486017 RepID=UPI000F7406E1|nr:MerR family transcriptional regulator [Loigolactobacillus zhaoyuanensis]
MTTVNETKEMYTVGEVSKICHISKKTLRFYDQEGIISPDYVSAKNNYRYYGKDTLSSIAIIKYYKQMGFKLCEMKNINSKSSFYYHEKNFRSKIEELQAEERRIHDKLIELSDWYDLLHEAQTVSEEYNDAVSIKYLTDEPYCCLTQDFHYDYMDSILNIPWVNHLEDNDQAITGPVILKFPSYIEKPAKTSQTAMIMQKSVYPKESAVSKINFGGIFASIYHVGDFNEIATSYQKIALWAAENSYICGPECYERYVVDYWTTKNSQKFVTEILIPIKKSDC